MAVNNTTLASPTFKNFKPEPKCGFSGEKCTFIKGDYIKIYINVFVITIAILDYYSVFTALVTSISVIFVTVIIFQCFR